MMLKAGYSVVVDTARNMNSAFLGFASSLASTYDWCLNICENLEIIEMQDFVLYGFEIGLQIKNREQDFVGTCYVLF